MGAIKEYWHAIKQVACNIRRCVGMPHATNGVALCRLFNPIEIPEFTPTYLSSSASTPVALNRSP